jgi:hypothetical protein
MRLTLLQDETDQYVDIHSRVPVIRPKNRGEQ